MRGQAEPDSRSFRLRHTHTHTHTGGIKLGQSGPWAKDGSLKDRGRPQTGSRFKSGPANKGVCCVCVWLLIFACLTVKQFNFFKFYWNIFDTMLYSFQVYSKASYLYV